MTDTNTQPVADEANPAPAAPVEATSAQNDTPDLDTLLSEFDAAATPQPQPEPKPQASDPVVAELQREVATLKSQRDVEQFQREFEPILNRVRGEISKDVLSDDEITDLIDGRAKRDARMQQAFRNRATNPNAWAKIEKALGAELSKKFSPRLDQNATADREAVAAAVRAASSTKVPDEKPPDLSGLSNAEYNQKVKAQYGFDPRV